MLKKMLRKLKKTPTPEAAEIPEKALKPSIPKPYSRLITAEGWKRLMMKKYRKQS